VRQIAALYLYDNELYAIEGTGKMVRDALENAARYFKTGGGFNPGVFGFNYDIAKGVEYEIDLTQAVIASAICGGTALRCAMTRSCVLQ